jgi:hypothetical protein
MAAPNYRRVGGERGAQLRAATGFERTLLLWRHKSLMATTRFLEGLTAGHGPPPEP